jgi:hypothetical protein
MNSHFSFVALASCLALVGCLQKRSESSETSSSTPSSVTVTSTEMPAPAATPTSPPTSGKARTFTVSGTVKRGGCDGIMPGSKDPSHHTNAACELFVSGLRVDPPLPGNGVLKDQVTLDDAPAMLVEPNVGRCKTVMQLHSSIDDYVLLGVYEPGCNAEDVYNRKDHMFDKGLNAVAQGKLKQDGTPIELKFAITAR